MRPTVYIGNIVHNATACITDMGLCKSANYNELENTKKCIYGMLPLRDKVIQNLVIFVWSIFRITSISWFRHDQLAIKICWGLGPRFRDGEVNKWSIWIQS